MTLRVIPRYALRAATGCVITSTTAPSVRVRSPEDWVRRRLCVHAWTMSRRLTRDTRRELLAIAISGLVAIGVMALLGQADRENPVPTPTVPTIVRQSP